MNFEVPTKSNKKLEKIVTLVSEDKELEGYLKSANINAMDRLMYSDHGFTHIKIVANAALKLLRILIDRGVKPSIVKDYDMKEEDAEVIVVLGAALHDIGMAVHRKDHDEMGISIAHHFLESFLDNIYEGVEKGSMISETLGTIYSHDGKAKPLTVEAGILAIADALDMAEGRARIPFEAGRVDIHSVSAMSIDEVEINEGEKDEKPVQIRIHMNNSAGIFQVDELLKKKVLDSGLQQYFNITAEIRGEEDKILKVIGF